MGAARKLAVLPSVDIDPPARPAQALPPRPIPDGPREVTILEVIFSSPAEWARTLAGAAGMAVCQAVICRFLWSLS